MKQNEIKQIPVFYKSMVIKPLDEYKPFVENPETSKTVIDFYQSFFADYSISYKPITKIFLFNE